MDNILNKIEKRLKLFHMNKNLDNVIDLNKSGEEQYLDLIRKIIERGKLSYDRHGTRTVSLVGAHMTFNMRNNEFPLLTTTTVSWRSVIDSILWFISNADNSAADTQLQDDVFCDPNDSILSNNSNSTKSNLSSNTDNNNNNNVEENDNNNKNRNNNNNSNNSNSNKKEKDDINNNISVCGINSSISNNGNSTNNNCHNVSIVRIIEKLRFFIRNARQTNGRRTIITDWNIIDLTLTNAAAFASAYHCLVKFSVIDGELSCHIRQQSADMYYAVPFNIASYALLTYIIAHVADLKLGDLIYTICSAHVNLEHIPFVQKQLNRPPRPFPLLNIKRKIDFIEDFKLKDFKIQNYYPWPTPNY